MHGKGSATDIFRELSFIRDFLLKIDRNCFELIKSSEFYRSVNAGQSTNSVKRAAQKLYPERKLELEKKYSDVASTRPKKTKRGHRSENG